MSDHSSSEASSPSEPTSCTIPAPDRVVFRVTVTLDGEYHVLDATDRVLARRLPTLTGDPLTWLAAVFGCRWPVAQAISTAQLHDQPDQPAVQLTICEVDALRALSFAVLPASCAGEHLASLLGCLTDSQLDALRGLVRRLEAP